ncbi:MAG: hypothetical protein AAGA68_21675 [Pseudomonadota bacterium]
METRSFALGVLVGAVACAGILRLGGPSVVERDGATLAQRPAAMVDADAAPAIMPLATPAGEPEQAVVGGESRTPGSAADPEQVAALAPGVDPPPMLASAERIVVAQSHRSLVREGAEPDPSGATPSERHAALETERREDAWAPFMEQAVQQFLAGHPKALGFDVLTVVCRSATCEIQAMGGVEGAGPTWSSILFDMRTEPWFEFEESASWSTSVEGGLALVSFLGSK